MTTEIILCGSIAFDTIMIFEGRFQDQILPDRVQMLNVSFLMPKLQLKKLAAELTALTDVQARYIGVATNGRYKQDSYRY